MTAASGGEGAGWAVKPPSPHLPLYLQYRHAELVEASADKHNAYQSMLFTKKKEIVLQNNLFSVPSHKIAFFMKDTGFAGGGGGRCD
jgi:hypothetical protein